MAHIKRTHPTYLLVGYRPRAGAPELYWRCPDTAAFERFQEYEIGCRRSGVALSDPAEKFGQAALPSTAKSARKTAAATKRSVPAPAPATAQQMPTVAEWIGPEWLAGTKGAKKGPFFRFIGTHSQEHARIYASVVRKYAPAGFAEKPMDTVTYDEAAEMLAAMIVCLACERRATAAGRTLTAHELSASEPPWDGACIAPAPADEDDDAPEEGDSTHFGRLQRASVRKYIGLMGALWSTARKCGSNGRMPAFGGIAEGPFNGLTVPNYDEAVDNNDLSQALSFTQLDLLRRAMPRWLAASIIIGAFAMFRRSELLGLTRRMLRLPLPDEPQEAKIVLGGVWMDGAMRRRGKTTLATKDTVFLGEFATSVLLEHLATYCSTPNPTACEACAVGKRDHLGNPLNNPHSACDFAASTPLWRDPATGKRPRADHYSRELFARAVIDAGLSPAVIGFKATPKLLRATGATLLLESGESPELVQRMGRWANVETLKRYYNRVRDVSKEGASRNLDANYRAELGIAGGVGPGASAENQVRFLNRRVENLTARIAELETALADAGIRSPGPQPPTIRVGPYDNDDQLRTLIATCSSRKSILEQLGVSLAKKSYQRLEKRADELGLDLPPPYASLRKAR